MSNKLYAQVYDLVVVGAGWYGLAAAKAATQMLPLRNMAVFETAESCGGTWSKNRLYPGLKSNNMLGTYEYPDFPMTEARYGLKPNSHIPGTVLHRYLTDFAKEFKIYDKIQFQTKVDVVEPLQDGAWKVTVTSPEGQRVVKAEKLVLATGLTSTPNMPEYKGAESYGAPLFHAKDFCARAEELSGAKRVTVVGGAKSAYDVAYALATEGTNVDILVKGDGQGPVWITPPYVTPFKIRIDQILLIRWMTWFAPCPWGDEAGSLKIRKFLHGTAVGRWFVDKFWKALGNDVLTAVGYDDHPEMKKLKPWNSAFWIGSGLSIHNYNTSLWSLVREGKIKVHIGEVDHLEQKKVVLQDGTVLDADAIVCSTGWRKDPTIKFEGLGEKGFGLNASPEELASLNENANKEVLDMFPKLKNQPKLKFTPREAEPLRMYRFMVPSTHVFQRNIAFAGAVSTVNTSTCATVQGQWIAAYLGDKLERKPSSMDEVTAEIMLHTQWGKWRYPCGYGAALPDMVFEGLPYVNLLLHDMGLETERKRGWLKELTDPYMPRDFKGLVSEWHERQDAAPLKA